MLSLYTRDDYGALGLEMLLEIERIPFRRIRDLAAHDQPLLIALGGDLSAAESAEIAYPSLVLNGGAVFAAEVLGVDVARLSDEPATLALTPPLWPAELCAGAAVRQDGAARAPCAGLPAARTNARRGRRDAACRSRDGCTAGGGPDRAVLVVGDRFRHRLRASADRTLRAGHAA
jgi:hypothetical protein